MKKECPMLRRDYAQSAALQRRRVEPYGWSRRGVELFGGVQPVWVSDGPVPEIFEAADALRQRAPR